MDSVYTGEIASDLLKPLGLMRFWLAQDVGRALVNFLLRGVLIIVAFELVVDLSYPQTAVSWLLLLCSLILGWLVSFGFRFLVNLAAFWSPDARGMGRFAFLTATFFCGQLMPVRFFPDWLQTVLNLTPFPAMFNTIIEVYLETMTGTAVYLALLNQLLWAVVLLLLGQWVLQTAVRRLVIQGG
jgi:ABC-2 type transport system permease protein